MGTQKYRTESWLRERYHGEGKTFQEIADDADVSAATIRYWIDRHNIKTRPRGRRQSPPVTPSE
jgi:transposase